MNTNPSRNRSRNRNENLDPHRINTPENSLNNRNGNGQPQVPSFHRSIRIYKKYNGLNVNCCSAKFK